MTPAEGEVMEEQQQVWLCGNPGWHRVRERIAAPDRDSAALSYARHESDRATVTYAGQGWYDQTIPDFDGAGRPLKLPRYFRVVRAPSQVRRGMDEQAAREALMALHPHGWAIRESYVTDGSYDGRADLLILPDGQGSVGYEIKTDRDSLTRLSRQVPMYDFCFSRRVLAVTPRHLATARTIIPEQWGLIVLDPDTHAITDQLRLAQPQERDPASRLLLTYELWSDELNALLAEIGVTKVKRLTNGDRVSLLHEHHGEVALRDLILRTLAARTTTRVRAVRLGVRP